jgi:hypothetical protein
MKDPLDHPLNRGKGRRGPLATLMWHLISHQPKAETPHKGRGETYWTTGLVSAFNLENETALHGEEYALAAETE